MARATLSKTSRQEDGKQKRGTSSESSRHSIQASFPADILTLPRMVGNRAVGQLWRSPTEQTGLVQRQCASCAQKTTAAGECTECKKKRSLLQRRFHNQGKPTDVPPVVHEVLKSPGQPLEPATRTFMEPRFGHDFSHVQIHTDSNAASATRHWNARAFTLNHNIYLDGSYDPSNIAGQTLLAHELTHVVQADAAISNPTQPPSPVTTLEREAQQVTAEFSSSGTVPAIRGLARDLAVPLRQGSDEDLGAPTFGNLPGDIPTTSGRGRVRLEPEGSKENPTWYQYAWVQNTKQFSKKSLARGKYDFVVAKNGEIWAVKLESYLGHTEAARGERVRWAGGIHFSETGKVKEWSNFSGHYLPAASFKKSAVKARLPEQRFVKVTRRITDEKKGPQLPVFQPTTNAPGGEVRRAGSTERVKSGETVSGEIEVPQRGSVKPSGGSAKSVTTTSGEIITKGRIKIPTHKISTPRGMRSGRSPTFRRGGGGGSVAAAGIGALVEAIAMPIIYRYMQEYYADRFARETRKLISEALEGHRDEFEALLDKRQEEIRAAQAEGLFLTLRVHINTNWVDTNLGRVLSKKPDVGSYQLVFEGGPPPKPYSRPQPGGIIGDFVRSGANVTLSHETIDIVLPGTDPVARHQRLSRQKIDALIKSPTGEPTVEFEALILRSYYGDLSKEDLRDYAAYQRKLAEETGGRGGFFREKYWRRMEALVTAPIEEAIAQAKVKSIPLDELRAHAAKQRDIEGQSSEVGGEPQASDYWSRVVGRIDAPLEERYAAARQRFLWTQPASKEEIAKQKAVVDSLKARLPHLRQRLAEASKYVDRNDNEPPHPDWSAKWRLEQEIQAVREEIRLEKRLLKDLQKKHVGKRFYPLY